jgi:hypothetical protein
MSEFWLVELEPDLAAKFTTRTGVWCGVKDVNGIKSVTDARVLSHALLDELGVPLLPAEQSLIRKSPSKRKP